VLIKNLTQQSLTGFAISTITVDYALLLTASLTEANFADSVRRLFEGRVIDDAQPRITQRFRKLRSVTRDAS
jgi:hypothetical protein